MYTGEAIIGTGMTCKKTSLRDSTCWRHLIKALKNFEVTLNIFEFYRPIAFLDQTLKRS